MTILQLIIVAVAVILLGIVIGVRRARLCGSSGGGSCRSQSTALTSALSTTLTTTLTTALTAGGSFLAAISRPASCPRRIAPTLAASNRCPAVRLVRIEIFNRWGAGVIAYSIICAIKIKWQRWVMLRIRYLVVYPLLMLCSLSPAEVVGKGGGAKPIICVGWLREALLIGGNVS